MPDTLRERWRKSPPEGEIPNSKRLKFLTIVCIGLILTGLLVDSPMTILRGLWKIQTSRANLLTDYVALGSPGAAFANSGLTTLLSLFVIWRSKVKISGPVMASVFAVAGFAFFGKNIYNSIPIILGVFLYSQLAGIPFRNVVLSATFGTCLGPAVSQITFAYGFPLYLSIPAGYLLGIFIGVIMQPLASRFVSFHNGFCLYNIGFTSGIIGMFVASFMRMFGLQVETVRILSYGNNTFMGLTLLVFFSYLFLFGYWFNDKSMKNYSELLRNSGQSVTDFISLYGYGVSLVNMAFVGMISTVFVLFLGAHINGPIIGAIMMVTGFGAFGKHPKNILPIIFGIYLASLLNIYDPLATGSVISAIFGTALAPVAGQYGMFAGVLAGFAHMSIVMNIGYLHGGMNLYNNGFSAGFVAGAFVPVIDVWTNEIRGKIRERIIKSETHRG